MDFRTENQLSKTSEEEDEEHCLFAMQLASASVFPMVFKAVLELDLLEIIAKAGPNAQLSPSEIASHLPTQSPEAPIMLDRMLRLLASYSILTCSVLTNEDGQDQRVYGLTPVCKFLIQNEDGVSLAPLLILVQDKLHVDSWHILKDAVLDRVDRVPAFELFAKDSKSSQLFNKAMANETFIIMKKVLVTYKGFEDLSELVDIGGGVGAALHMIISKYPKIKGINFDLPHVLRSLSSYPGIELIQGDMFVKVPKGEAIFLKWILHDWSDEQCLKLLKNCYEALPNNGKVIVVESILPAVVETNPAAKSLYQVDLIMMNFLPGGKERTEMEFEALAKGAGFTSIKVVCCVYNYWVMEFYKN